MTAWLQRYDFSSEDLEIPDASVAKEIIRRFDWARECELERRHKGETCPAGLGLLINDSHILHICPRSDGSSLVHYHFPKRRRLFGLFPVTSEGLLTWPDLPSDKVELMIDCYFHGDHASIERLAYQ